MFVSFLFLNEVLHQIGNRTADGGHGEKSQSVPSRNDTHQESHKPRHRCHCSMDDVWKSHDCQRHVGHIVKEASQEPVSYLSFDKHHRQNTDDIRREDAEQDVDDDAMLLHDHSD